MRYVFSESLKDTYAESGEKGILALWARTMIDAGKSLLIQHVENQKGNNFMKSKGTDILMQNKIFLWIALAIGFILLIPLIAMQFDSGVVWSVSDFVTAGALLFGAGLLFVLVARKLPRYRVAIAIVLAIALLYIWAELAVGIFTNWGS
jgi:hypothetical protein